MDIFYAYLDSNIWIMNIYAPNHNRLDFWHKLLENPLIDHTTIIGGDLNFTIGHEES